MTTDSGKLILELIEETKKILAKGEDLKTLSEEQLKFRMAENSWNITECLEHLNLYGDFYIPAIEKAIMNSTSKPANKFKSGFFGNYFAKTMSPKEKLNKMKTFKDKNPINSKLNHSAVIDRFIKQQKQLLDLLNQAQNANLNTIKVGITITKLIKLKLGDTFRFIINHNIRHIVQIEKILNQVKTN